MLEGTPAMPGTSAGQRVARQRAPRERGPPRPNEAMQQAVHLYNAGHDIQDIARQLVRPWLKRYRQQVVGSC